MFDRHEFTDPEAVRNAFRVFLNLFARAILQELGTIPIRTSTTTQPSQIEDDSESTAAPTSVGGPRSGVDRTRPED